MEYNKLNQQTRGIIMKYVFLTGTNRGLGQAVSQALTDSQIISITRSPVEETGNIYKSFQVSFTDTEELEDKLSDIYTSINPEEGDEIYLLNIAGSVNPVKSLANLGGQEMLDNYKINTLAPTLLIKGFVKHFQDFQGEKRIVTVSSGAAVNGIEGWGAYCSSKAAIDMVHDVLSKENKHQANNVKSAIFYPGVIDTGMQETIRSSDIEEFPNLDRFKEYKENDVLRDAKEVANALIKVVTLDDFGSDESYNVKDYI